MVMLVKIILCTTKKMKIVSKGYHLPEVVKTDQKNLQYHEDYICIYRAPIHQKDNSTSQGQRVILVLVNALTTLIKLKLC